MIKFHLRLCPVNEQVKPYEVPFGHVFQGVIFGWLHEQCPRLVHELHTYEKVRPYAINCHIHRKKPLVGFTIVSYSYPLTSALIQAIRPLEGKILTVARKKYRINRLEIEKVFLEELINQSEPVRHFHIRFATPVQFHTAKGNYPVRFPLPSLLFGNLSTIWNNITKKTAQIDRQNFLRWVGAHCYPSGYRMRSAQYFIKTSQKVAGGQGFASYRIKTPNQRFYEDFNKGSSETLAEGKAEQIRAHYMNNSRWVDILCRLGEYTNVGGNRTAGMGVFLYYPKKYIHKRQSAEVISPPI